MSGKAISPAVAVTGISKGLLSFQRNNETKAATLIRHVSQSPIAMRPRSIQAPSIVPIAAA